MNFPDAIIVGGQKCGSSWLVRNLLKHPEIAGPKQEIHFFDKASNFAKGKEWYAGCFADFAGNHKVLLEKTPDYLFSGEATEDHIPNSANRIHQLLPKTKILIILRDPAVRAISAAQHILRSNRIPPETSIRELLVGNKQDLVRSHGVIEYGFYARDVEKYLNLFGKDQVHVMVYEEVMANKEKALRAVFRFLGVDETVEIADQQAKVNAPEANRLLLTLKYYLPFLTKLKVLKRFKPYFKGSPSLRKKDDSLLEELAPLYDEDIRALAGILGREELWGRQA